MLDLLVFTVNVISAGQVLQMSSSPSPSPRSPLPPPYPLPKRAWAKTRAYEGSTLSRLQLTGHDGAVPRLTSSGLTLGC